MGWKQEWGFQEGHPESVLVVFELSMVAQQVRVDLSYWQAMAGVENRLDMLQA